MRQSDDVTCVKGIGEKTAQALKKMNIETVGDLINHYPTRYVTFEAPVAIAMLQNEGEVALEGVFVEMPILSRRGKIIVTCTFADPSGKIEVVWFNQPFVRNAIKRGVHYVIRGHVRKKGSRWSMQQPKLYAVDDYRRLMNVLQPVYPLTAGVSAGILSKAVKTAISEVEFETEMLPNRFRKQYELLTLKHAIEEIHFPKSFETMQEARNRLVFDELFVFALMVSKRRAMRASHFSSFPMKRMPQVDDMINSLPFPLTKGQQEAINDILADTCGSRVMNRIIQGDVGSGKTIVAAVGLLNTALNGLQGCMMVPTEVLARQHYEKLSGLFEQYGVKTELLTGSLTATQKRAARERIAAHEVDVIIGTHALIQESVKYDKLALVITDEQHRFGVRQRELLSEKSEEPHMLVMSATPIPRTLSLMLYGDLDLSVIAERPSNRLPIKNCVVGPKYRPTAYKFMAKQVAEGHRAYVICPKIDSDDESSDGENVMDYAASLREAFEELGANIKVAELHGKMKPALKNEIMEAFEKGEADLLVSTTVVEVGIDVPEATVMMIEDAERFGLAQLHQLRGRVGRGSAQSYCIFVNTSETEEARERLEILNKSNDGFYVAEEDLRLRGPGDMLGLRQSGEMQFVLADIFRDAELLKQAFEAADGLTAEEAEEIGEKIGKITMLAN